MHSEYDIEKMQKQEEHKYSKQNWTSPSDFKVFAGGKPLIPFANVYLY